MRNARLGSDEAGAELRRPARRLGFDVDRLALALAGRGRGHATLDAAMLWGSAMALLVRTPAPPLGAYVALLWYEENEQPGQGLERVMPTGAAELVMPANEAADGAAHALDGATAGAPLVVGPQSRSLVIRRHPGAALLGVHFRPGGGRALLGVPLDALRDRVSPLDEVLGSPARRALFERVRDGATPGAMLDRLERALLARLAGAAPRHPAVPHVLQRLHGPRPCRVEDLAAEFGLSARWLRLVFNEEVGLGPRRYARVARFHRALAALPPAGRPAWAAVAAAAGYCDQPHLVREFREFAGVEPTRYVALRTENEFHIAVR